MGGVKSGQKVVKGEKGMGIRCDAQARKAPKLGTFHDQEQTAQRRCDQQVPPRCLAQPPSAAAAPRAANQPDVIRTNVFTPAPARCN